MMNRKYTRELKVEVSRYSPVRERIKELYFNYGRNAVIAVIGFSQSHRNLKLCLYQVIPISFFNEAIWLQSVFLLMKSWGLCLMIQALSVELPRNGPYLPGCNASICHRGFRAKTAP